MSRELTDLIYDLSVDGLFYLSHITGFTYREINVIVFCIAEPLLYVALLIMILRLRRKVKSLTNVIRHEKASQT
jgi:hypothetical protein